MFHVEVRNVMHAEGFECDWAVSAGSAHTTLMPDLGEQITGPVPVRNNWAGRATTSSARHPAVGLPPPEARPFVLIAALP
jgi:hypothetical protein